MRPCRRLPRVDRAHLLQVPMVAFELHGEGGETDTMTETTERRTVVITGASSGVGRACARAFAAEGARIGLVARSREALAAAADEVRLLGGEALVIALDVADAEAVFEAAATVEHEFGPIDVWVNNAMVTVLAPVWEITPDEYRRVTEVTYLGYVHGTLAALRSMRPRDQGSIIQVGSALEYRSIPLQSAYCGAKAAMRGFTDSLRTELIHERSAIKLSSLQLPAVNTPQFDVMRTRMPKMPMPVPPIYEPKLIAEAVVWASHHGPREMVVGGGSLRAVAAQRLAPGLVDRFLAKTGYDAQLRDEPVGDERRDNLYEPLPGDRGARGSFGDQSIRTSPQLWMRFNARALAMGVAAVTSATLLAFSMKRD